MGVAVSVERMYGVQKYGWEALLRAKKEGIKERNTKKKKKKKTEKKEKKKKKKKKKKVV